MTITQLHSSAVWRWAGGCLCACLLMLAAPAWAQKTKSSNSPPEATVQLSADSVDLGDSVVYQITIDGVSAADPPARLTVPGAKVEYIGGHDESSRSVMIINGRTTENSVLRYIMQWRVTPSAKGRSTVAGFTMEVDGYKLEVPSISFSVTEPKGNPNFRLTLECETKTAYVGQPVHMKLVWLLGSNVRSASFSGSDGGTQYDVGAIDPRPIATRNRPPQNNEPYRVVGFLGGEAIVTQGLGELGGRQVPRITLDLVITPREPGKIEVGPFRVATDEVVSQRPGSMMDSFFDSFNSTRRTVIPSNSVTLEVKPLPTAGKPADFAGLVGEYAIETKAGNTEANVGDPIPFTVTITGPEPLDALKAPDLDSQADFASAFKPAPEGWEAATGAMASMAGERSFSTTIRPTSTGVTEIPAVRLPYFDTKTGQYAVASSKPIPLKVRASREVTAADALRSGSAPGFSMPVGVQAKLTPGGGGVLANSESLDALRDQRLNLAAATRTPTGIAVLLLPPAVLAFAFAWAWKQKHTDPLRAVRRAAVRHAIGRISGAAGPEALLHAVRSGVAPFFGAEPSAVVSSDAAGSFIPSGSRAGLQRLLLQLEGASFDRQPIDLASAKRDAEALLRELADA